MTKCAMCDLEIEENKSCFFASYTLNVGDRKLSFCCARCAEGYKESQTPPKGKKVAKRKK